MSKLADWFRRKEDSKTRPTREINEVDESAWPPPPIPNFPMGPTVVKQARQQPPPVPVVVKPPPPVEPARLVARKLARYNEEPKTELFDRFADAGVLGEGGMCLVHRILDRNFGRFVAMKVLKPDLATNPDYVRGFLAEARVTGQLDHPSIPPVHEIGVDPDGTRYFTMKMLGGVSLGQWAVEQHGKSTRAILQELIPIVIKVCEAVAFAHDRGVVHRDIKPDNVMVGRFGEVHLVDWGLYQLVAPIYEVIEQSGDGDQSGSESGETLGTRTASDSAVDVSSIGQRGWTDAQMGGTLQYMAPEQAEGRTADIDGRTDVFGVGTLLYSVLGGRGPYSDYALPDALRRAQRGHYLPLDTLNPEVPGGLARIVHRAMAPRPEDRYPSALDLKADLQEFLGSGFQLPMVTFAPKERIVREGELGDAAYIIVSGTCVVLRHIEGFVQELAKLGPGQVFGEMALLSQQPRNATVEAETEVTALVVTRDKLDAEMKGTFLGQLLLSVVQRYREADEERRRTPIAAFDLD